MRFFGQMWRGVGRAGARTDTSPHTAAVFFSLLPKTVIVTNQPNIFLELGSNLYCYSAVTALTVNSR